MNMRNRVMIVITICLVIPAFSHAQTSGDLSGDIHSLEGVLQKIYNTMIVKCKELIGVGRGIAAFAAIWYIGNRVWGHIARAEPVDVYPLLRPFVIGFAILNFPFVVSVMNGIMQPTETATAALVNDSNNAIAALLKQKQDALQNSSDWEMYVGPDGSGSEAIWEEKSGDAGTGTFSGITNWAKFEMAKASYNLKNSIKVWLSEILQILFEAAALCINTVRTFYMIILAILGPLVFGLSVFDGMQHLIRSWIARYINIFLWVPVANIFGSIIGQIQEEMIKLDIVQLNATGHTSFGATDAGYIVFLIMGIIGYFTVPSVANYIIHAGGGNTLMYRITSASQSAVSSVASAPSAAMSGLSGGGSGSGNGKGQMTSSQMIAAGKNPGGRFGVYDSTNLQTGERTRGGFLADKLRGGDD